MTRFITFLMGKKYEPCKSCETLKEQLEIVNEERKNLLDTILGLVKPESIPQVLVPQKPLLPTSIPWRIRQRELENSSKNQARIRAEREAEIGKLEKELDLKEELGRGEDAR